MNLPLVVDIAIGLIFIYLTFSLLTSEIQELITTLLQWRAVHLKESIEGLLAGNENTKMAQARVLANKLYENPVLNTLNQEAKGFAALVRQKGNQTIGQFLRDLFKKENVFGDRSSGPSYIAAESFAASLLDTLGIPSIVQKFTLLKMQDFNENLTQEVATLLQNASITGVDQNTLNLELGNQKDETPIKQILQKEFPESDSDQALQILKHFYNLKRKLFETIEGFQKGGFDLTSSIDRLEEVLIQYIQGLEEYLQGTDDHRDQLIKSLKEIQKDKFGSPKSNQAAAGKGWSSEKTLLLRSFQPNLTEAVEIVQGFWNLKRCWSVYKEVRKGAALDAIAKLKDTINNQPNLSESIKRNLLQILENTTTSGSDYGYERIRESINQYPKLKPSLKISLIEELNIIIEKSYTDIRELIETQQESELPTSIKNTLLQILENERRDSSVSVLSYEFEKVRRAEFARLDNLKTITEEQSESPVNPSLSCVNRIEEIIDTTDEIISNSYEEIKKKINNETRLPLSTKQSLLNLINSITSPGLDFEYDSLRKAIENQPGLTLSLKQSFLNELDATINSCLNKEYEIFKKAIEDQANLNLSVKQSLLLLATAVTLRKDHELAKLVDHLLGMGSLPDSVDRNLLLLAQQAQIKVEGVKEELNQFRREIENWFDRSMERSSGVYKRNSKLIAIIIGSLVAVTINADTIHIVTRLSKDQVLRSTVAKAADQIATNNSEITARCLSFKTEAERSADEQCRQSLESIEEATKNLSLPIGWSKTNRSQQWEEARSWGIFGLVQYLVGWLVSGIAFSMGSSFWYELLGKFINVRNSGVQPPPPKDQPNSQ